MSSIIKKISSFEIEFIENYTITHEENIGINDFKHYSYDAKNGKVKVYLNLNNNRVDDLLKDQLFLLKLKEYYDRLEKFKSNWKRKSLIIWICFVIMSSILIPIVINNSILTFITLLIIIFSFIIIHRVFLPKKDFSNDINKYISDIISFH